MFSSILLKSRTYISICFLLALASCCQNFCPYQETIEIPLTWHTPIREMTVEDPYSFNWWEALNDPLLTYLIEQAACRNQDIGLATSSSRDKLLETMNAVSAEIAKNYIELRGMQMRSILLQANLEAQTTKFTMNEGLSKKGHFSLIDQNENRINLDSLSINNAQMDLAIRKTIFHLSTLLSYPPGDLYETLIQVQPLPTLPCEIPIGSPEDIVQRNPTILEARREYYKSHNQQTFYNYQKTTLQALENVENGLAALNYAIDKMGYLCNNSRLKTESYRLIQDLYRQGLKDDRDLLTIYQEYLTEEDAFIQGQIDLLTNYVNLYQALGAGWQ